MEIIKDKTLALQIIPVLATLKYREIPNNYTGGDNDYIAIDTSNKEYCWFEYGSGPNHNDLFMYQDKRLRDVISMTAGGYR